MKKRKTCGASKPNGNFVWPQQTASPFIVTLALWLVRLSTLGEALFSSQKRKKELPFKTDIILTYHFSVLSQNCSTPNLRWGKKFLFLDQNHLHKSTAWVNYLSVLLFLRL
jgi:hypothetical protein